MTSETRQQLLQAARERAAEYRTWVTGQPAGRVVATMVLGLAVAAAVYAVVRGLIWMLGGLIDWLFVSEAPPSPPAAAVAEPPSPLEIAAGDTLDYLAGLLHQWSQAHAFGGVDPAVLPAVWLLIGGVLLLFTRTLSGAGMWLAWSAATVWAAYISTPAGNPLPAALLAGFLALAWCVWLLFTGFARAVARL